MDKEKYALVTGGSRGIGRAICLALGEMGYHILINYRSNEEAAKETVNLLSEQGAKGSLLPFDVGAPDQIKAAIGQWQDDNEHAVIEVLVNNAGVRKDNLMIWMKPEEWDQVLRTNLDSFFYITRLLIKPMVANRFGRIINVVSVSGLKGIPGQTNYSASKAGMIGATKSLAQEIGRRRITVNAVAPGFINTEMTEGIEEKDYKALIPVGRFGTSEEVAHAVSFLASEKASYINGAVLSVDGGMY